MPPVARVTPAHLDLLRAAVSRIPSLKPKENKEGTQIFSYATQAFLTKPSLLRFRFLLDTITIQETSQALLLAPAFRLLPGGGTPSVGGAM